MTHLTTIHNQDRYGCCWDCTCGAGHSGYWNLDDCEQAALEHEVSGESPRDEDGL